MSNVQLWGESLRLLVELGATAAFALSGEDHDLTIFSESSERIGSAAIA